MACLFNKLHTVELGPWLCHLRTHSMPLMTVMSLIQSFFAQILLQVCQQKGFTDIITTVV